ncbi:MAG: hypothetical protein BEN18_07125 [Epulopiscium sp. Nuni2H_MBin001]|nr:MAG: hypothetical protein BEN18_07125 [Epulopiscium sp. Nuni2H_MBin001]
MNSSLRIALLSGGLLVLGTGSIDAYSQSENVVAVVEEDKVAQYEDVFVEDIAPSIVLEENEIVTQIQMDRWETDVTIITNGIPERVKTTANTVEELLLEQNIDIAYDTALSAQLNANITEGFELDIKTTEVNLASVEEIIPYSTTITPTDQLALGVTEIVEEGINGIKENIIEEVYFGGELVQATLVSDVVLVAAQNRVVNEGTYVAPSIVDPELVILPASTSNADIAKAKPSQIENDRDAIICENTGTVYNVTDKYILEATAYTDIPGDIWYNITYTGDPTFVGMVAVDKNVIPLGTILYVEGYGVAIAGDVGGAINGYDIDLFMNTYNECITFGRQNVTVYRLEDQTIDVQQLRKGE